MLAGKWWGAGDRFAVSFTTGQLRFMPVQTIASESLHPNAKQVVEWMDNGVFDALKLGFLDKCVLVISADPEEKSTIEAWSACVSNHGIIDLHVG